MKKHIKIFLKAAFLASVLIFSGCKSKPQPEGEEMPKTAQVLIYDGQFDEAKKLFERKQEPDFQDEEGNTALHAAVKVNNVDMVEYMLSIYANTEIRNNEGLAPIHLAMLNATAERVENSEAVGDIIILLLKNGKLDNMYLKNPEERCLVDDIAERQIKDQKLYSKLENYFVSNYEASNFTDENNQNLVHHFVKAQNESYINKITEFDTNNNTIGITLDRTFGGKKQNDKRYTGIILDLEDNEGKTPLDFAYETIDSLNSVKIAARLILAKCRSDNPDFEYFENAIKNRNYDLRSFNNKTPLHIAGIKGHRAIAEFLLDNKANPNLHDNDGFSPLHEAVKAGKLDIVNLLTSKKADINSCDCAGRTPLLTENKQEAKDDIYTALLNAKADVTLKDIHGNTALHIASWNGASEEILKRLHESGADINARNEDGATPLFYAVNEGHEYQIKFYTSRNADIYAADKGGNSPLTIALERMNDGSNKALLEMLVTSKNINTRDSNGNTPLHIATTRKASMECLEYLMNCGADLDTRNSAGDTILHEVVRQDNRPAGEILIARGSNIYATNAEGYSPLRIALEKRGNTREWFCSPQVILFSSDTDGNTPLHYAAEWKYNDSVIFLLDKKAEINKRNNYGETPLYSAIKANSPDTLKLLIAYDAEYIIKDLQGNTPLHYCINKNAIECARTLLSKVEEKSGKDSAELAAFVDAKNLSGRTPLALSASLNYDDIARLLLEYNANVNESDVFGNSIIMEAVKAEPPAYKIMQLLVAGKVNVNAQNKDGRSAYHEVAELNDSQGIRILSTGNGNALIRDNHSNTPFSILVNKPERSGAPYPIKDPYPLIDMLLGSDKKLTDSNGNTPLHAAVYANVNEDIMKKLINKYFDEIDRRNSQGITALNYALTLEQNDLAIALIRRGANPFIKDDNNECALDIVFKTKDFEVMEVLVKNNLTRTDTEDNTILHYAARNQKSDVLLKLVEWGLDKTALNHDGETPAKVAERWGNGSEARNF